MKLAALRAREPADALRKVALTADEPLSRELSAALLYFMLLGRSTAITHLRLRLQGAHRGARACFIEPDAFQTFSLMIPNPRPSDPSASLPVLCSLPTHLLHTLHTCCSRCKQAVAASGPSCLMFLAQAPTLP